MDNFTRNLAEFGSKLFILCVFTALAIVVCSAVIGLGWGVYAAVRTLLRRLRK